MGFVKALTRLLGCVALLLALAPVPLAHAQAGAGGAPQAEVSASPPASGDVLQEVTVTAW
jgi:hypothetical protein